MYDYGNDLVEWKMTQERGDNYRTDVLAQVRGSDLVQQ